MIADGGFDRFIGGSWIDVVSWRRATSAVRVFLDDGLAFPDNSSTVLVAVENLVGSRFADYLEGDGVSNEIIGGGGDDQITGNGGRDRLIGGAGDDEFVSADGRRDVVSAVGEETSDTPTEETR